MNTAQMIPYFYLCMGEVSMFPWFSFLSYALITAITPGPNNIMSMTNAAKLGLRKGFPFQLGVFTGFTFIILICTFFCSALSEMIPKIKLPMMIMGAVYMLRLAWNMLRSTGLPEDGHTKGSYFSGLILQFINPKLYLYCIVSLEAYILPYYHGQWVPLIFFALLLALFCFASNLCWAMSGSVFRALFSKYARITNGIMAALLVYCAISLFL